MNKIELLDQVRELKVGYNIRQDSQSNDIHRKRITSLVTNLLLELPVDELDMLFDYKISKRVSDIEKACVIATVLESALFNRLKNETLRCDPMENENKHLPLTVWNSDIAYNFPIIEEIIAILKEGSNGTVKLDECTNRKRLARATRINQKYAGISS